MKKLKCFQCGVLGTDNYECNFECPILLIGDCENPEWIVTGEGGMSNEIDQDDYDYLLNIYDFN